jgi:hypothetical protein
VVLSFGFSLLLLFRMFNFAVLVSRGPHEVMSRECLALLVSSIKLSRVGSPNGVRVSVIAYSHQRSRAIEENFG